MTYHSLYLHLARAQRRFCKENEFLMVYVVDEIMERLSAVSRDFSNTIALFGTTDYLAKKCIESDKIGEVIRIERPVWWGESPKANKEIEGDNLGLAPQSCDLICAPLTLHWSEDLLLIFNQLNLALRPDGLFTATFLGTDTLTELRQSLAQAESEICNGMASRIDIFPSLSEYGSLLQQSGFALPVVDRETITIRYDHPSKLISDLRNMGATNRVPDKDHNLTRAIYNRMCEIYQSKFSDDDNRIRATFEIIFLSGWKPHENQQKPLKPGSAKMSLAQGLEAAKKN